MPSSHSFEKLAERFWDNHVPISPADAEEELRLQNEELRANDAELRAQHAELMAALANAEHERFRYRELFEFAPDAYLVTDSIGLILEANKAASELLG